MASTGHSGSHSVQSMHSSGSIVSMFGPSWKQSTGHTSTQSVYLHLMQASVTTKVMMRSYRRRPKQRWRIVHQNRRSIHTRGAGRPHEGAAARSSNLLVGHVEHDPVDLVGQHDLAAQA